MLEKSQKFWAQSNPFRILRAQEKNGPTRTSPDELKGPVTNNFSVAAVWLGSDLPREMWTKDYYIIGRIPGKIGTIVYSTCPDQDYWLMQARLHGADYVWKNKFRPFDSTQILKPSKERKTRPGKMSVEQYLDIMNMVEQGQTQRSIAERYNLTVTSIYNLIHRGPPDYIRAQLDQQKQTFPDQDSNINKHTRGVQYES